MEQATTLEHAIDDGGREVIIVQHGTPVVRVLVRGEDHRAGRLMALGHDVVEDVGRVGAVGQVANFVALCVAPHNATHVEHLVMCSSVRVLVEEPAIRST